MIARLVGIGGLLAAFYGAANLSGIFAVSGLILMGLSSYLIDKSEWPEEESIEEASTRRGLALDRVRK